MGIKINTDTGIHVSFNFSLRFIEVSGLGYSALESAAIDQTMQPYSIRAVIKPHSSPAMFYADISGTFLPRLIFDYPTISSVASYASEQLGAGAATMAMPVAGAMQVAGAMPRGAGALDQQLSVAGMVSWQTPGWLDGKNSIFDDIV